MRLAAAASLVMLLLAAPARAEPARVVVGAYVNDIQSIDLKLHSYAVDVYLWFRWTDPELAPADTVEFINPSELWGHARAANFEKPVELPNGELYQVIRVQGRFSKKLPLFNYPFDRQTLLVTFEDSVLEADKLVYVPADASVALNPDLYLPGYRFGAPAMTSGTFAYPTDFGDLRPNKHNVFSRVRIEVPIFRPVATFCVKLLLPILCVVLCAALMFVISPTYVDARVGIGITALLTIVALQITLNEDLPDVDYLVLMDKIYIGAYLYVIAGLGVVVRTAQLIETPEGLARAVQVQRRAAFGLSFAFTAAVVAMVVAAIIQG